MENAAICYQCALEAALIILEESDSSESEPKHLRLSRTLFRIIDAMRRYEQKTEVTRAAAFSLN